MDALDCEADGFSALGGSTHDCAVAGEGANGAASETATKALQKRILSVMTIHAPSHNKMSKAAMVPGAAFDRAI